MNLKWLEYYDKLVEEKNFSKVATFFGVSQPTITMAIKRLEESYQTHFFERDYRYKTLRLTASGENFHRHVKKILQELALAQTELVRLKARKIKFGLPPIIGTYLFPLLAPQLLQANLLNRMQPVEQGSQRLLSLVSTGSIDFAFIGILDEVKDPNLVVNYFANSTFKIIVSKNHPLAHWTRPLYFKDLASYPFIALTNSFTHNKAFSRLETINAIHPPRIFHTDDIQIVKKLVAQNVGISFITSIALRSDDDLVALDLADKGVPEFKIGLAYRESFPPAPALLDLITTFHPWNN